MLLADWEESVPDSSSAAAHQPALRTHAQALLLQAADCLAYAVDSGATDASSQPCGIERPCEHMAAACLERGLSIGELMTGCRALVHGVLRRWPAEEPEFGARQLHELTCFVDVMEQSSAAVARAYTSYLQQARELVMGSIAHDLRNPLGAIHYSAEALALDRDLPPQPRAMVELIRNSTRRMEQMVSQLLDYVHVQLGDPLPLIRVPTDLGKVLRNIVDELQASHRHDSLHLELRGALTGSWDPGRLARLLSNLIGNALEHGSPGAPVRVTAWREEQTICVAVHNHGRPIPPEQAELVFDPLRRAVAADHSGAPRWRGLGLGLFIAREIAAAHGGSIDLESSDAAGTTFTVRLPA